MGDLTNAALSSCLQRDSRKNVYKIQIFLLTLYDDMQNIIYNI